MKKLILFLFCPFVLFAQTSSDTVKYVSSKSFSKIYNKYLTEAILGDSDLSNLGSYVSLDIVKPKLSFALSKNWYGKNDKNLKATSTFKFDGGIKNDISTVFSNEEYSTDINIKLDQSLVLSFWGLTRYKFTTEYKSDLDSKITKLNLKKTDYDDHKILLDDLISSYKLEINNNTNLSVIEIKEIKQKIYDLKIKLETLELEDYDSKKEKIELESKWSSVRLVWLNLYAKYGTQKLYTYGSNLSFSEQIEKITPENHELGLGLNLFYDQVNNLSCDYKNHWAYIFNGQYSINYSYAETNNSSELSSEKIVTENNIGNTVNGNRFIEKTTNAYLLGSFDTFKRHQIAFDINKKIIDNLHLHIYGDYNEIDQSDKYNGNFKNFGLGLVIGLQKKSDTKKKTIVNFELFTLFKDIEDKFQETGDEFYKRAVVGIRTTIPFDNLLKGK